MMFARMNRAETGMSETEADDQLSATRPRVNYYSARLGKDPFPDPSLLDPVDADQHEDVKTEIGKPKTEARNNGLHEKEALRLDKIVDDHVDVFRISFSSGPPAKLRPLKIELFHDARPVKVCLRNYTQEQKTFLSDMVKKLVEHGMAYPNPTSAWACAPLLVAKPGPAQFRFTVDLRPVNRFTVKQQYPMPNIEQELGRMAGSRFFATMDLSHCYWQLELDLDSQSSQSFITPEGIFSPTRVLHGAPNAVTHLQSALAEVIPRNLKRKTLAWLDDLLLHAQTESGLIDTVEQMLQFCADQNIKLHPAKCLFFAREIR